MSQRRTVTSRSQEPRARFAEELKALREKSGDSLRQLSEKVGWDFSLFGKMENGHTLGSADVVQALDQYFGADTFLVTLWELALGDQAQYKDQYRTFFQLEAEALSMWHFGLNSVPGVLQTREYATEVLAAGGMQGEELARHVEARLNRGAMLLAEDAPRFRTILYESVLRLMLRDEKVWRQQLEHLLTMSRRPNVTVQVLPFSVGPFGMMNTEAMFLQPADGRSVAYTENDLHGEVIVEGSQIERLQSAYDAMRDLALSPVESRRFIGEMLEEAQCDPSI
ncbi:helix-turn-helix transcriptional regulator [Streptomyces sp. SID12501]|uniref:Helix-turn-helix transcriptional regulator n=1 Tax=Streptomyces sp. SID12501 TaxID=2706042 RepID=A0A6B3BYT8_9ACTN|nr:helix-turn-helix transcriptional regulator [Streptomyces sp. SID12501]NEC89561.1 helix-turn-helix transcriptional regulator [Streptomyces sp. SID12501]